jgi:hypothetical protein
VARARFALKAQWKLDCGTAKGTTNDRKLLGKERQEHFFYYLCMCVNFVTTSTAKKRTVGTIARLLGRHKRNL